jgi:hypothetical protein
MRGTVWRYHSESCIVEATFNILDGRVISPSVVPKESSHYLQGISSMF